MNSLKDIDYRQRFLALRDVDYKQKAIELKDQTLKLVDESKVKSFDLYELAQRKF